MAIVFDTKAELEAFLEAFVLRDEQFGQAVQVSHPLVSDSESSVAQPELERGDLNLCSMELVEPIAALTHAEESALAERKAELPMVFATAS